MNRPHRKLALCSALFALSAARLWAQDVGDLFQTPTTDVATQDGAPASSPVLLEYQQAQDKLSYSFSLYSAAGGYGGWTSYAGLLDPAANFAHTTYGGLSLTSSIDLRPYDYLRLHGSVNFVYPTATNASLDLEATINEMFFDYATPSLVAVRAGKFSVSWGNASILSAANLPGRTVNASIVSATADIRPEWLLSSTPSLWVKATVPLGKLSLTGLSGLPDQLDMGLSAMGYGALAEYVTGKTYLSLGGYYKSDKTPRLAATVKTSGWGFDLFVDASMSFPSFPDFSGPLPVVTGGLVYQTSEGPDIRLTAEARYNGENVAGSGALVSDALTIGGLSHAAALAWHNVAGTALSAGGTWYQSWADWSGAVVPSLSVDVLPLITVRMVVPFVYGADGSEYRKSPPSEAGGYLAGFGLFIVLQTTF